MKFKFSKLSVSTAHLEIEQPNSSFGITIASTTFLRQRHGERIYKIGKKDSPLLFLEQPFSPDDAWNIKINANGEYISDKLSIPKIIEEEYLSWIAKSNIGGEGIIGVLPTGSYLLLRCSKHPIRTEKVLLRNELVTAPYNTWVLNETKPIYMCIIGDNKESSPKLNQPLIGVSILNYVGNSSMHGVIFFPYINSSVENFVNEKDLILIIPMQGELVINAMEYFSSEEEKKKSLEQWNKQVFF